MPYVTPTPGVQPPVGADPTPPAEPTSPEPTSPEPSDPGSPGPTDAGVALNEVGAALYGFLLQGFKDTSDVNLVDGREEPAQSHLMGSSGDDLIIAAPDSKQVLIGGGGNDCLLGGQGHVALVASNLKDTDPAVGQDTPKNFNVLVAGDGDILVGGNGQDAFFFGAHCGSSTVLQFDPQHDKIVIDSHTTGITSVEQLHVQDDVKNHGVIIDINHGDRVEIIGHSTHDLIVSDDPNASAVMFIDSSAFAHGSGHS